MNRFEKGPQFGDIIVQPEAICGVTVKYKSDILGEGYMKNPNNKIAHIFTDVEQIQNIPARNIARSTLKDGRERLWGMWRVIPVSDA